MTSLISFLFRVVIRSMTVQKYRFASLVLTIVAASALLVILSTLYFNAESQLALELSGVPNMVVEPKKSIVAVTSLNTSDVLALKSKNHFWRNNIVNAVPVMLAEGEIDEKRVKVAGVWFQKRLSIENESYVFGILRFKGWGYTGDEPDEGSVIIGANVGVADAGETVRLRIGNSEGEFRVAGVLKTGSFWDDYIFVELETLSNLTGRSDVDQILVSALIKPKDELAVRAELYGIESLSADEFEAWYCSPYASTIAYTIKEVLPNAEVKILRKVTEVQEGLIRTSSAVFAAMFGLTFVASITAIFSAEKMYVSSKMGELGIMAAIGASRQKILLQLMMEISVASLISAAVTYFLSRVVVEYISSSVFGVSFEADSTLVLASAGIPFLISIAALVLLRRGLERNVVDILRW